MTLTMPARLAVAAASTIALTGVAAATAGGTTTPSASTAAAPAGPAISAAGSAEIYVVQGLPDATLDAEIDGEVVEEDLATTDVAGPFDVGTDGAEVRLLDEDGAAVLEQTLSVDEDSVTDLVAHLPADPDGEPVATTFDLELEGLPAGKGTVAVAHTAAVAPADIRVDGEVLFANVANGEGLDLVVPEGTYEVDIVPTGEDSPVVFGPVDLEVAGQTFHAVYAVGDPEADTMSVAVHTVGVDEEGSSAPSSVPGGTSGVALVQRAAHVGLGALGR